MVRSSDSPSLWIQRLIVISGLDRTTVKDKLHQKNVALTEEELDLIHRLAKSENPDSNYDECVDL